jgi:hypothetical protein
MQTIQELANRFYPEQDHSSITYNKRLCEQVRELVEFYVTEALKTASENVELTTDETYAGSLGNAEGKLYDITTVVDKESILSAYSLSNIK